MPSNTIIIAAAGSRKTTSIVEEALRMHDRKILLLTYTIENHNLIRQYFIDRVGLIPSNITVQTWFSFLLQHMVRPYQNFIYDNRRIETIAFVEGKSARFVPKRDTSRYYFSQGNKIYTDKISEFVTLCNEVSGGLVVSRLEEIFDHVFVDEVQDLAGYDFDVLELFLNSQIDTTFVGDNRQATYFTNCSPKYARFRGQNIIDLFSEWQTSGLCQIQERTDCFRCNQIICDFADALYPRMAKTASMNTTTTGHDGLFFVRSQDIDEYISEFDPQVLRYMRGPKTEAYDAMNFGMSKGQTFNRVLIFPTRGITKYLRTGKLSDIGDISKFYVGITRAKYSVALVHDGTVLPGLGKIYDVRRTAPLLFDLIGF